MITTSIFPGRYVQGARALGSLGEELRRFGPKALLLVSPTILERVLPAYRERIEQCVQIQVERFGGECSDKEIARVTAAAQACGASSLAGLGGGKTLDTVKAAACGLGVPAVSVPTTASTDAPTSALAVIYTDDSVYDRLEFFPSNPALVLVDSEVIVRAPLRYLVAGMGDALATWFEADSCSRSFARNMTGRYAPAAALALARLCYDTLLEYGLLACQAAAQGLVTPAVERIIEANILLSGLGFESGGLAAPHAIHNGLTQLEATHGALHGEKVAIGTLASLFLTDKGWGQIEEVYEFCASVGLPTTLADIGLEAVTDDDLLKVATKACSKEDTVHNEPRPIEPGDVVAALRAADAYGQARA